MPRAPIPYSETELNWIKACSDLPRTELHFRFVQAFNRPDVTVDHLKSLCTRKGWTAGPDGRRRNKGKSRLLTEAEVAWLHANAHLPIKDTGPAFRAAFPSRDITDQQLASFRRNHSLRTGRTGRFEKGQTPPNKGRKGFSPPGSEKGWFKKGARSGVATKLYQPIGTERMTKDGYIQRKVNDDLPLQARWKMVQHINWEAVNGPLPADHVLKCLDGNRQNIDAANWIAIPRGMLPRLNARCGRDYDTAPAELKPLILTVAQLEHKAADRRKDAANG